jgi:hypothetical protein
MRRTLPWKMAAVALILAGLFIRYKIAQRRFNRRSMTGLQWFPSYGNAVITRFLEGLATTIGKIMIFIGVLCLLSGFL